jgi:hypothetical protein
MHGCIYHYIYYVPAVPVTLRLPLTATSTVNRSRVHNWALGAEWMQLIILQTFHQKVACARLKNKESEHQRENRT